MIYPTMDFLLAGLFFSWFRRLPASVYLHNCLAESRVGLTRMIGTFIEKEVFGRADKVYAMSRIMQSYYLEKGYKCDVLVHPLSLDFSQKSQRDTISEPIVGFSGTVYETNLEALRDLVSGKEVLNFRIFVSTTQNSIHQLREAGLISKIDRIVTLPSRESVLEFQAECDILFCPLSFSSKYQDDMVTMFPTKVTDYWLSRRPIIVYGSERYMFVRDAEHRGYGLVVTQRSPLKLAESIRELAESRDLRLSLVENAAKAASEHDVSLLVPRLMRDLGIRVGETSNIVRD
jgi:glycosyltransferase involved in cell wall biosynthesis